MAEFIDEDLQGSYFRRVDLSDSELRAVVLQRVRIVDAWIDDVEISARIERLVVNEVDVTDYVNEELDRRHPERVLMRTTDPDELRAAWAMAEDRAATTLARALALPSEQLDERVNGEFSYLQTLRHLVMATDRWINGPIHGHPEFHPLGIPPDVPEEELAGYGFVVDATPSLDEVLTLRRERMATVAAIVRDATPESLARVVVNPNGGDITVVGCVQVVLREEWAHDRYANRDLGLLGAPS